MRATDPARVVASPSRLAELHGQFALIEIPAGAAMVFFTSASHKHDHAAGRRDGGQIGVG